MKLRLSLSSAIVAFGLVLVLGFTAVVSTSLYALRELKVGGPLYSEIKLGNDLVADILPPPAYVLEAYLEATLVMRQPDQLAAHSERLVQLRKDYEDRKAFWSTSDLSPNLKATLVSDSDAEVQKFWKLVADRLLPALSSKDLGAAELAYAKISDVYATHRAIIDRIKAKGSVSPEQLVDDCLDLLGPVEIRADTKQELTSQAKEWGQISWDNGNAQIADQRVGEMLQLIAATREYQFA